jgi:ketosteroid isomerase-like protein
VALSSSDLAAIRAAEEALAEAFEASDPTVWVDSYTDDAIFVGPGRPAIEGRRGLLDLAREFSISSMEIVADSTVGAGDFASTPGAGKVGERAEGLGCADTTKTLSHGLAQRGRRALAHRA